MESNRNKIRSAVITDEPLQAEDLLQRAMYGPAKPRRSPRRTEKPGHYKVVSISLYVEDIERLERMVSELKRRGVYKANKSQLIRYALQRLDTDDFHREDFDR